MKEMRQLRSRFHIAAIDGGILFLVDDFDESNPTMTITNDAEAVVAWAAARYPGHRIVYRDTEGRWDEIAHSAGTFRRFQPYRGWAPET